MGLVHGSIEVYGLGSWVNGALVEGAQRIGLGDGKGNYVINGQVYAWASRKGAFDTGDAKAISNQAGEKGKITEAPKLVDRWETAGNYDFTNAGFEGLTLTEQALLGNFVVQYGLGNSNLKMASLTTLYLGDKAIWSGFIAMKPGEELTLATRRQMIEDKLNIRGTLFFKDGRQVQIDVEGATAELVSGGKDGQRIFLKGNDVIGVFQGAIIKSETRTITDQVPVTQSVFSSQANNGAGGFVSVTRTKTKETKFEVSNMTPEEHTALLAKSLVFLISGDFTITQSPLAGQVGKTMLNITDRVSGQMTVLMWNADGSLVTPTLVSKELRDAFGRVSERAMNEAQARKTNLTTTIMSTDYAGKKTINGMPTSLTMQVVKTAGMDQTGWTMNLNADSLLFTAKDGTQLVINVTGDKIEMLFKSTKLGEDLTQNVYYFENGFSLTQSIQTQRLLNKPWEKAWAATATLSIPGLSYIRGETVKWTDLSLEYLRDVNGKVVWAYVDGQAADLMQLHTLVDGKEVFINDAKEKVITLDGTPTPPNFRFGNYNGKRCLLDAISGEGAVARISAIYKLGNYSKPIAYEEFISSGKISYVLPTPGRYETKSAIYIFNKDGNLQYVQQGGQSNKWEQIIYKYDGQTLVERTARGTYVTWYTSINTYNRPEIYNDQGVMVGYKGQPIQTNIFTDMYSVYQGYSAWGKVGVRAWGVVAVVALTVVTWGVGTATLASLGLTGGYVATFLAGGGVVAGLTVATGVGIYASGRWLAPQNDTWAAVGQSFMFVGALAGVVSLADAMFGGNFAKVGLGVARLPWIGGVANGLAGLFGAVQGASAASTTLAWALTGVVITGVGTAFVGLAAFDAGLLADTRLGQGVSRASSYAWSLASQTATFVARLPGIRQIIIIPNKAMFNLAGRVVNLAMNVRWIKLVVDGTTSVIKIPVMIVQECFNAGRSAKFSAPDAVMLGIKVLAQGLLFVGLGGVRLWSWLINGVRGGVLAAGSEAIAGGLLFKQGFLEVAYTIGGIGVTGFSRIAMFVLTDGALMMATGLARIAFGTVFKFALAFLPGWVSTAATYTGQSWVRLWMSYVSVWQTKGFLAANEAALVRLGTLALDGAATAWRFVVSVVSDSSKTLSGMLGVFRKLYASIYTLSKEPISSFSKTDLLMLLKGLGGSSLIAGGALWMGGVLFDNQNVKNWGMNFALAGIGLLMAASIWKGVLERKAQTEALAKSENIATKEAEHIMSKEARDEARRMGITRSVVAFFRQVNPAQILVYKTVGGYAFGLGAGLFVMASAMASESDGRLIRNIGIGLMILGILAFMPTILSAISKNGWGRAGKALIDFSNMNVVMHPSVMSEKLFHQGGLFAGLMFDETYQGLGARTWNFILGVMGQSVSTGFSWGQYSVFLDLIQGRNPFNNQGKNDFLNSFWSGFSLGPILAIFGNLGFTNVKGVPGLAGREFLGGPIAMIEAFTDAMGTKVSFEGFGILNLFGDKLRGEVETLIGNNMVLSQVMNIFISPLTYFSSALAIIEIVPMVSQFIFTPVLQGARTVGLIHLTDQEIQNVSQDILFVLLPQRMTRERMLDSAKETLKEANMPLTKENIEIVLREDFDAPLVESMKKGFGLLGAEGLDPYKAISQAFYNMEMGRLWQSSGLTADELSKMMNQTLPDKKNLENSTFGERASAAGIDSMKLAPELRDAKITAEALSVFTGYFIAMAGSKTIFDQLGNLKYFTDMLGNEAGKFVREFALQSFLSLAKPADILAMIRNKKDGIEIEGFGHLKLTREMVPYMDRAFGIRGFGAMIAAMYAVEASKDAEKEVTVLRFPGPYPGIAMLESIMHMSAKEFVEKFGMEPIVPLELIQAMAPYVARQMEQGGHFDTIEDFAGISTNAVLKMIRDIIHSPELSSYADELSKYVKGDIKEEPELKQNEESSPVEQWMLRFYADQLKVLGERLMAAKDNISFADALTGPETYHHLEGLAWVNKILGETYPTEIRILTEAMRGLRDLIAKSQGLDITTKPSRDVSDLSGKAVANNNARAVQEAVVQKLGEIQSAIENGSDADATHSFVIVIGEEQYEVTLTTDEVLQSAPKVKAILEIFASQSRAPPADRTMLEYQKFNDGLKQDLATVTKMADELKAKLGALGDLKSQSATQVKKETIADLTKKIEELDVPNASPAQMSALVILRAELQTVREMDAGKLQQREIAKAKQEVAEFSNEFTAKREAVSATEALLRAGPGAMMKFLDMVASLKSTTSAELLKKFSKLSPAGILSNLLLNPTNSDGVGREFMELRDAFIDFYKTQSGEGNDIAALKKELDNLMSEEYRKASTSTEADSELRLKKIELLTRKLALAFEVIYQGSTLAEAVRTASAKDGVNAEQISAIGEILKNYVVKSSMLEIGITDSTNLKGSFNPAAAPEIIERREKALPELDKAIKEVTAEIKQWEEKIATVSLDAQVELAVKNSKNRLRLSEYTRVRDSYLQEIQDCQRIIELKQKIENKIAMPKDEAQYKADCLTYANRIGVLGDKTRFSRPPSDLYTWSDTTFLIAIGLELGFDVSAGTGVGKSRSEVLGAAFFMANHNKSGAGGRAQIVVEDPASANKFFDKTSQEEGRATYEEVAAFLGIKLINAQPRIGEEAGAKDFAGLQGELENASNGVLVSDITSMTHLWNNTQEAEGRDLLRYLSQTFDRTILDEAQISAYNQLKAIIAASDRVDFVGESTVRRGLAFAQELKKLIGSLTGVESDGSIKLVLQEALPDFIKNRAEGDKEQNPAIYMSLDGKVVEFNESAQRKLKELGNSETYSFKTLNEIRSFVRGLYAKDMPLRETILNALVTMKPADVTIHLQEQSSDIALQLACLYRFLAENRGKTLTENQRTRDRWNYYMKEEKGINELATRYELGGSGLGILERPDQRLDQGVQFDLSMEFKDAEGKPTYLLDLDHLDFKALGEWFDVDGIGRLETKMGTPIQANFVRGCVGLSATLPEFLGLFTGNERLELGQSRPDLQFNAVIRDENGNWVSGRVDAQAFDLTTDTSKRAFEDNLLAQIKEAFLVDPGQFLFICNNDTERELIKKVLVRAFTEGFLDFENFGIKEIPSNKSIEDVVMKIIKEVDLGTSSESITEVAKSSKKVRSLVIGTKRIAQAFNPRRADIKLEFKKEVKDLVEKLSVYACTHVFGVGVELYQSSLIAQEIGRDRSNRGQVRLFFDAANLTKSLQEAITGVAYTDFLGFLGRVKDAADKDLTVAEESDNADVLQLYTKRRAAAQSNIDLARDLAEASTKGKLLDTMGDILARNSKTYKVLDLLSLNFEYREALEQSDAARYAVSTYLQYEIITKSLIRLLVNNLDNEKTAEGLRKVISRMEDVELSDIESVMTSAAVSSEKFVRNDIQMIIDRVFGQKGLGNKRVTVGSVQEMLTVNVGLTKEQVWAAFRADELFRIEYGLQNNADIFNPKMIEKFIRENPDQKSRFSIANTQGNPLEENGLLSPTLTDFVRSIMRFSQYIFASNQNRQLSAQQVEEQHVSYARQLNNPTSVKRQTVDNEALGEAAATALIEGRPGVLRAEGLRARQRYGDNYLPEEGFRVIQFATQLAGTQLGNLNANPVVSALNVFFLLSGNQVFNVTAASSFGQIQTAIVAASNYMDINLGLATTENVYDMGERLKRIGQFLKLGNAALISPESLVLTIKRLLGADNFEAELFRFRLIMPGAPQISTAEYATYQRTWQEERERGQDMVRIVTAQQQLRKYEEAKLKALEFVPRNFGGGIRRLFSASWWHYQTYKFQVGSFNERRPEMLSKNIANWAGYAIGGALGAITVGGLLTHWGLAAGLVASVLAPAVIITGLVAVAVIGLVGLLTWSRWFYPLRSGWRKFLDNWIRPIFGNRADSVKKIRTLISRVSLATYKGRKEFAERLSLYDSRMTQEDIGLITKYYEVLGSLLNRWEQPGNLSVSQLRELVRGYDEGLKHSPSMGISGKKQEVAKKAWEKAVEHGKWRDAMAGFALKSVVGKIFLGKMFEGRALAMKLAKETSWYQKTYRGMETLMNHWAAMAELMNGEEIAKINQFFKTLQAQPEVPAEQRQALAQKIAEQLFGKGSLAARLLGLGVGVADIMDSDIGFYSGLQLLAMAQKYGFNGHLEEIGRMIDPEIQDLMGEYDVSSWNLEKMKQMAKAEQSLQERVDRLPEKISISDLVNVIDGFEHLRPDMVQALARNFGLNMDLAASQLLTNYGSLLKLNDRLNSVQGVQDLQREVEGLKATYEQNATAVKLGDSFDFEVPESFYEFELALTAADSARLEAVRRAYGVFELRKAAEAVRSVAADLTSVRGQIEALNKKIRAATNDASRVVLSTLRDQLLDKKKKLEESPRKLFGWAKEIAPFLGREIAVMEYIYGLGVDKARIESVRDAVLKRIAEGKFPEEIEKAGYPRWIFEFIRKRLAALDIRLDNKADSAAYVSDALMYYNKKLIVDLNRMNRDGVIAPEKLEGAIESVIRTFMIHETIEAEMDVWNRGTDPQKREAANYLKQVRDELQRRITDPKTTQAEKDRLTDEKSVVDAVIRLIRKEGADAQGQIFRDFFAEYAASFYLRLLSPEEREAMSQGLLRISDYMGEVYKDKMRFYLDLTSSDSKFATHDAVQRWNSGKGKIAELEREVSEIEKSIARHDLTDSELKKLERKLYDLRKELFDGYTYVFGPSHSYFGKLRQFDYFFKILNALRVGDSETALAILNEKYAENKKQKTDERVLSAEEYQELKQLIVSGNMLETQARGLDYLKKFTRGALFLITSYADFRNHEAAQAGTVSEQMGPDFSVEGVIDHASEIDAQMRAREAHLAEAKAIEVDISKAAQGEARVAKIKFYAQRLDSTLKELVSTFAGHDVFSAEFYQLQDAIKDGILKPIFREGTDADREKVLGLINRNPEEGDAEYYLKSFALAAMLEDADPQSPSASQQFIEKVLKAGEIKVSPEMKKSDAKAIAKMIKAERAKNRTTYFELTGIQNSHTDIPQVLLDELKKIGFEVSFMQFDRGATVYMTFQGATGNRVEFYGGPVSLNAKYPRSQATHFHPSTDPNPSSITDRYGAISKTIAKNGGSTMSTMSVVTGLAAAQEDILLGVYDAEGKLQLQGVPLSDRSDPYASFSKMSSDLYSATLQLQAKKQRYAVFVRNRMQKDELGADVPQNTWLQWVYSPSSTAARSELRNLTAPGEPMVLPEVSEVVTPLAELDLPQLLGQAVTDARKMFLKVAPAGYQLPTDLVKYRWAATPEEVKTMGSNVAYFNSEANEILLNAEKLKGLTKAEIRQNLAVAMVHELVHAAGGEELEAYEATAQAMEELDPVRFADQIAMIRVLLATDRGEIKVQDQLMQQEIEKIAVNTLNATVSAALGIETLLNRLQSQVYAIGPNATQTVTKFGGKPMGAQELADKVAPTGVFRKDVVNRREHSVFVANEADVPGMSAQIQSLKDLEYTVFSFNEEAVRKLYGKEVDIHAAVYHLVQLAAMLGKTQFALLMKDYGIHPLGKNGIYSVEACLTGAIQTLIGALASREQVASAA